MLKYPSFLPLLVVNTSAIRFPFPSSPLPPSFLYVFYEERSKSKLVLYLVIHFSDPLVLVQALNLRCPWTRCCGNVIGESWSIKRLIWLTVSPPNSSF